MTTKFSAVKGLQFAPEYIPKIRSNEVQDLIEASYSRTGEAETLGKKYGLTLDKQLSNANQKVFYDKQKNPSVVFRGSKKELERIFEEFVESKKEFINFISQIVWDKPHQYLFINTDSQRLFKNFDEIIIDE